MCLFVEIHFRCSRVLPPSPSLVFTWVKTIVTACVFCKNYHTTKTIIFAFYFGPFWHDCELPTTKSWIRGRVTAPALLRNGSHSGHFKREKHANLGGQTELGTAPETPLMNHANATSATLTTWIESIKCFPKVHEVLVISRMLLALQRWLAKLQCLRLTLTLFGLLLDRTL